MSLKSLYTGLLLLFILPSIFIGQNKTESIDKLLNLYSSYGKFNGSVLVSDGGNIIYKKGFGMANMEWDMPNDTDTKFRLASITKQFTGTLIMQLVAEGKIDLQAPITTYLPDYPKETGDKVTVHHLLTHSSGIPSYTSLPDFFKDKSRDPATPDEFVETFSKLPLEFEPGETFSYNNSGYFLLGVIIEKITGKTYEEAMHAYIFEPLKMNNSGYDNYAEIIKNRATGYEQNGTEYRTAPYLDMSLPYAAGSLYSTVEDLYLWDQALYTEKLLPKKYMDVIFEKHIPSGNSHYGYGWGIGDMPIGNTENKVDIFQHSGGINGFNTLITRIPSDKSMIVLLSNTGGAPLNEMTEALYGILKGENYDLPKKSLAAALQNNIDKEGIEAGIAHFATLKKDEEYDLNEGEINRLGYQYLSNENLEAAVAIFKLNMDAFPKSANAYDSYAEGLMSQGKNEMAIKYYRKSIELNPGNQNGIDMLKKLGDNVDDLTKELVISDAILESYIGEYELAPTFVITISKEGQQMKAQATGQPIFDIFPKSENEFYLKVIEAQLVFNKNDEGTVESLTLFQGGQEMTGKKK